MPKTGDDFEPADVGRALANLGLTAGRQRPSLEEMVKAARARQASDTCVPPSDATMDEPSPARVAMASDEERLEVEELLTECERRAPSDARLAAIRSCLADERLTSTAAAGMRDELGRLLVRRRTDADRSGPDDL